MACAVRGSAPMAKRSLRQWLAAIRPKSQGSSMKVRKWSTDWTRSLSGGTRSTAASSPPRNPTSTSGCGADSRRPRTRCSTTARDLGAAAAAAHGGGGGELGGGRGGRGGLGDAYSAGAGCGRAARRIRLRPGRSRWLPPPLAPSSPPAAAAPPGAEGLPRHRRKLLVLAHPAPVDPVLEAPHPAPLDRESAIGRYRVAVAARDEGEGEGLRPIGPKGASGREPGEVLGEHRTLADRVDPRFREPARVERGGVARREHERVPPSTATSPSPSRTPRRRDRARCFRASPEPRRG